MAGVKVSRHAVERYVQRVNATATMQQATWAVEQMVREGVPMCHRKASRLYRPLRPATHRKRKKRSAGTFYLHPCGAVVMVGRHARTVLGPADDDATEWCASLLVFAVFGVWA